MAVSSASSCSALLVSPTIPIPVLFTQLHPLSTQENSFSPRFGVLCCMWIVWLGIYTSQEKILQVTKITSGLPALLKTHMEQPLLCLEGIVALL